MFEDNGLPGRPLPRAEDRAAALRPLSCESNSAVLKAAEQDYKKVKRPADYAEQERQRTLDSRKMDGFLDRLYAGEV